MIRQFTFIAVVVLLASMAAPPARGQCDEFTGTTLGPEWFVRAGVGSYSLTERPGFLRYTLGSWGHWNVCAHTYAHSNSRVRSPALSGRSS